MTTSQTGARPGGGPPGGGHGGPWGGDGAESSGGPFRAFRSINYTYYWSGSVLSITSFFFLIIARGWLVYELTKSEFWVTTVSAAALFPALFFSIYGGVIADRFDRKKILLFSEASNFITLMTIAVLVWTNYITEWYLLALALGNGITFSLASPARFSIVPSLVAPQNIGNATALSSIMFSGGALIGPPIAGFLLEADPALAFFVGAVFVGLAMPLFLLMRLNPAPQWGQGMRPQGSVWQNIREGLSYIRQSQILSGLVIMGLIATFFGMPYQALLPVFAEDVLDAGASGLGYLGAAGGVGGIAASLVIATFSSVNQLKAWLVAGAIGMGIFIAGFAQAETLVVALVFAACAGWFFQMVMTGNFSLVQVLTPDHLRGRVLSVRLIVFGLQPFALLITGWIAEAYGAPTAVTLTGIMAFICATAALIAFPALRTPQRATEAPVAAGAPPGQASPPGQRPAASTADTGPTSAPTAD